MSVTQQRGNATKSRPVDAPKRISPSATVKRTPQRHGSSIEKQTLFPLPPFIPMKTHELQNLHVLRRTYAKKLNDQPDQIRAFYPDWYDDEHYVPIIPN